MAKQTEAKKDKDETQAAADLAKKEAAQKAASDASAAAVAAAKAADEAKRLAEQAAAAQAEAEGRVLCTVPRRYGVVVEGKIVTVEKGSQSLPREIADHPYSVAQGVKVVGLPSK